MKREYLLFIAGTLAVTLIAVLITVLVGISSQPAADDRPALVPSAFGPEDFLIPEPQLSEPEYIPSRPRLEFWTDAMINEYWVDPESMAEDFLREQADAEIREIIRRMGQ